MIDINRSIFIDSSDIHEIRKWNELGIIDGVTTNQYILFKDKIRPDKYYQVIEEICKEVKNKPVSVELTNSKESYIKMVDEAKRYNSIAENIVVKVPLIPDTYKSFDVISHLIKENIAINVTVLMTFEQLLLAITSVRNSTKNSFISFFWGRSIEDHAKYRSRSDFMARFPKVGIESTINQGPSNIVSETVQFLKDGHYDNPKLIVGSIRTAVMVGEAFAAGAHIVTIIPEILKAMSFSQRTIETIEQFDDAWKEIQKKS